MVTTRGRTVVTDGSLAAGAAAAGPTLLPFKVGRIPSAPESFLVAASGLFLTAGYALIIIPLRIGDVAVVSPLHYTSILFALRSSYRVWGTTRDAPAIPGSAIICPAGLYTVHRERARRVAPVGLLIGVPCHRRRLP